MKANISLLGSLALAGLALVGCQKPAEKTAAGSTAASTTVTTSTEASSSMAGKTIRIATEGTYKPFSITKADGSLTGFDVDFMRALCAEMKANCEINPQDWDGLSFVAVKPPTSGGGYKATPKSCLRMEVV